MCGIAGWIAPRGTRSDGRHAGTLADALAHRGPDDQGFLAWNPGELPRSSRRATELGAAEVWLAHRRLSILDLSPSGWQPMASADGRYQMTFNGEIYNYLELRRELQSRGWRFESESDTEVLLAALQHWGPAEAPRHLRGMFAYAMLDTMAGEIFLARDHFGIKPLYYTWTTDGAFAFASEIHALLALPDVTPTVAPQPLYRYLRYGRSDEGTATMFDQVHALAPAQAAHFNLSDRRLRVAEPYWTPGRQRSDGHSFEDAAEQLRQLFLDSVRLHLRSDVPVAVALSGGVDSSAIAMAIRHLEGPDHGVRAFSYLATDPKFNEERWIDLVADHADMPVTKVRPEPEHLPTELSSLIAHQEEPFGGTSIYAQHCVFRAVHDAGIKVTLDGQGADETFGGYPTFQSAALASALRSGRLREASARLQALFGNYALDQPVRATARTIRDLLPQRLDKALRRLNRDHAAPDWIAEDWFREQGVHTGDARPMDGDDPLQARLRESLTQSSLPALLRHLDRNSMSFSVESRVPFLTPELVDYALALPPSYIVAPSGETKSVLRRALSGLVPDAILDRRDKVPFATPEHDWLVRNSNWVQAEIGDADARGIPALQHNAVASRWNAVLARQARADSAIWRAINLAVWTRQFGVQYS